jgi:cell division septal protein FtsQ
MTKGINDQPITINGQLITNPKNMSNKARSILKVLAVVLVLLAVVMQIGWVIIPSISIYKFWFVVIAFGLLLISSK